jgi:hypothetical protein
MYVFVCLICLYFIFNLNFVSQIQISLF